MEKQSGKIINLPDLINITGFLSHLVTSHPFWKKLGRSIKIFDNFHILVYFSKTNRYILITFPLHIIWVLPIRNMK